MYHPTRHEAQHASVPRAANHQVLLGGGEGAAAYDWSDALHLEPVVTAWASACDNGLYCDGLEICDVVDGCQAGAAPSTAGT